jgi:cytochrome P450
MEISRMSLAPPTEFDPFSPSVVADPHPHYAALRAASPVHHAVDHDLWLVTRYDDVVRVIRDPLVFSSAEGMGRLMTGGVGPNRVKDGALFGMSPAELRVLIATDPPDHTTLRRLVSRAFTPRAISALEPRLRALCGELVDGLLQDLERGPADLVSSVAMPFPVTVIAELLGIPAERRDDFKRWSDALVGSLAGEADLRGARDAMIELTGFVVEQIERRRREPSDDLIGRLVEVGEELGAGEIVAFVILLLVAGNETTTNLIGNGAQAFADHPAQLERLVSDPSLVASAVEEVFRYDGPVQALFRGTTQDAQVSGVTIPAGSLVMVCFAAANRDPDHYADPQAFDVARNPQDHLGLGHGIHYCLGASLARLEARIVLDTFLDRAVALAPAGGAEPLANAVLRGFRSFPVRRSGVSA